MKERIACGEWHGFPPMVACLSVRDTQFELLSKVLADAYESVSAAKGTACDSEAFVMACQILAHRKDKKLFASVLRLLLVGREQTLAVERLTLAIEKLAKEMPRLPLRFSSFWPISKKAKPRPKTAGAVFKGRKTPFMQDQLKAFKKYLDKLRYDGEASKLYALAEQCWRVNIAKWESAKSTAGRRRGYSCPKAMADAYRNLMPAQVAAL